MRKTRAARVAITMQKGGVGKTALTTNLAAVLAASFDQKVLVVDLDGQRNATEVLLGPGAAPAGTIESVLRGEASVGDVLLSCDHLHSNLHVLPGSRTLADWEQGLAQRDLAILGVGHLLRDQVPEEIEVVLIDTPPAGGLWLRAALAAAGHYVVVGQCEYLCWIGVDDLLRTVDEARAHNPSLELAGVVINRFRQGPNEHQGFLEAFRRKFGGDVLDPVIPERIAIAESTRYGRPVAFMPGQKDVADLFTQIAGTLLERVAGEKSATD